MVLALFGIESDGLSLAVNLLLLFLVVLWLALVYWTFADARRRIEDPMLVGCATLASLFPFIGTVIYMIVRPPEYLADAHERELEIAAAEAQVAQLEELTCHYCDFEIEKSFLRCPSCLRRLKEPCQTCGKPLDPRWKICPCCESEIAQSGSRRRPARAAGRGSTAAGARSSGAAAGSRPEGGAAVRGGSDAEPTRARPAARTAGAEAGEQRSGAAPR
ncbi:MAG: double zinc ribbon domain-containing protein [Thermoleophilaceae bacterium]